MTFHRTLSFILALGLGLAAMTGCSGSISSPLAPSPLSTPLGCFAPLTSTGYSVGPAGTVLVIRSHADFLSLIPFYGTPPPDPCDFNAHMVAYVSMWNDGCHGERRSIPQACVLPGGITLSLHYDYPASPSSPFCNAIFLDSVAAILPQSSLPVTVSYTAGMY